MMAGVSGDANAPCLSVAPDTKMNARRPLLLLAACTSAQAAVGVFEDDMVSRPIDWNGLFRCVRRPA